MADQLSFYERALARLKDMIPTEDLLQSPDAVAQIHELRAQLLAKEMELEALRQERDIFEQALDHQPVHTAIFDREMRYIYLNPDWVEDLPMSRHELMGKSHYEVNPNLPEHWREKHQQGLAGETLSSEADLYTRPSGENAYLKWKLTPWKDANGEIGGIVLYTDVVTAFVETERKRLLAQQALEASEARYRQIFEGNHAIKLLVDREDGRIIDANLAAEGFYGYSRSHLCTMKLQDLQPDSLDVRSILMADEGKFQAQHRIKNGAARSIEIVVSAVTLDQKRMAYLMVTDITEQERARSSLLEHEERLRVIYEGAHDGIFLVDPQGYYVDANPAGCRMTGYTLEELRKLTVDDLRFPGEVDQQALAQRRKLWTEGGTVDNLRLRRKDGTELWVSMSIAPVRIQDQNFVMGIKRNITAQRQAQRDLLIKQRAIDEAMNAIALADMNGILTYVNPRFLRYWGYDSADEVLGRSAQDFWEQPAAAGKILSGVQHGSSVEQQELVARRKDGSTFIVELYASAIHDEQQQPIMLVGVFLDVTEQRLAERALKESEQRYRTVVSALAEGILFIDRSGRILSSNPGAIRMFGNISENANVFNPLLSRTFNHDGTPMTVEQFPISITLQTGKPLRDVIVGLLSSKGTMYWFSVNTEPIFEDGSDLASAVVASVRDITERRLAEQTEREAQMLAQQLQQERETHHFRARMFSTIAHELRTPLASISTTAEVLQRYADRFTVQDRLQRLGRIRTIVQHLNTLLDDMSYMSKSQSGDLQMQPEALELDLFCNDIITDVQLAFQVEDRISLNLTGSEPIIYFDANMLHKILNNLLSNAVKYTSPTGQIRLDVEAYPKQLTIVVQDDGIGIPEEDQERLFGLFQRGSNVGRIKGTGLGLAIVKDTVDVCGGEISFESSTSNGTTFTVRLPLTVPV